MRNRNDGRRCQAGFGLRLVFVVSLHVLAEVVAAHKSPIASGAHEFLLPGVRSLVPRQLVGSREATAAVLPLAEEGTLAGVTAGVRFQVARFEVVFTAIGVVALEDAPSLLRQLCAGICSFAGGLCGRGSDRRSRRQQEKSRLD